MSESTTELPALVSLGTLADRWELAPTTVRRLLDQAGVVPFFLSSKKGGTIRYRLDEIEQFLEDAKGQPVPHP